MKLFLINRNFEILRPIITNSGGLLDAFLTMDLNGAYELKLKISTELAVYDQLTKSNFGVRLQTEDLDLCFFKGKNPDTNLQTGTVELTYFSASYLLKYSQRILQENQLYKGSAFNLLQNLHPDFEFELLGSDKFIEQNTGILNNFAILEDTCKSAGGWSWREQGITQNNKTKILIGDFNNITQKYKARNWFFDDPFDSDTIQIKGIKQIKSGESISHLLIFSDSGKGSENQTIMFLNQLNANYILPDFPLVNKGKQIRGQIAYYIFDQNNKLGFDKFETFVVQNAVSPQEIYNKGVAYIKSKKDDEIYEFDFGFPKIILPGEKVDIEYLYKITNLDGTKRTLFDIKDTQTFRKLNFDLSKLKT